MEEGNNAAGAPAGAAPHHGCFFCTVLPMLERRWDEATQGHFRNAHLEFLKGLRSLLDERIAHISREEQKGTHVSVE
jgi:hypothetical protein